ncbi:MAG: CoB--CoM heterodisulfide reductase iron-sulfur subunit B family protein [Candidatus Bathyarchaeota archaeon]|nr:MAG: CoB--CoM heterodisulfide reductase iron-sulfur subunit B family protein [Candidatus Bathyarchaeota archaeon]
MTTPKKSPNSSSKFLLFLGCAIPYRVTSYEISTRKVLAKLGITLIEMTEYNCCGLPIDPVNHEMMVALAARNLCLAEKQGLNIVTLCPGCAGTLRKVNKKLKQNKELRERINGYLKETGLEFKGTIEAKHLLQLLVEDIGLERIKDKVKRPLTNMNVTEHAGCHVSRPADGVDFENPEDPEALKNLIEVTGAKYVDYTDKIACCGAPIAGVNDRIPLQLTREKLVHVKEAGAQALITVCPFCHMMFDTNQPRIERMFNESFKTPVLHYPQLLGLAMDFSPEELDLKGLRVDPTKIVSQIHGAKKGDSKW